jgi:hypothetical protein
MGHPAVKLQVTETPVQRSFTVLPGGLHNVEQFKLPTDVLILGILLASIQIIDGVLTAIGMHHFGTDMEANLLLRGLMSVMGYVPALIIVKSCCVALTGVLCYQTPKISWLKPAFVGIIALYTVFAVVPWTVILVAEYLA